MNVCELLKIICFLPIICNMFNHVREMRKITFLFVFMVIIHLKVECNHNEIFGFLREFAEVYEL